MHHTCFPSLHLRRNTIRANQRTCLSLSNFMEIYSNMTSRRTHHEPTLTLQLTGSIQSTCLQLMVQPSLSRAHRIPSRLHKLDAHPSYPSSTVFSPEDQLFIEITMLHLYVKSNSLPLREAPISFSRIQTASYELHHQMWLRLYGCLRTLTKGSSQP